jgi:hypothetical protein
LAEPFCHENAQFVPFIVELYVTVEAQNAKYVRMETQQWVPVGFVVGLLNISYRFKLLDYAKIPTTIWLGDIGLYCHIL